MRQPLRIAMWSGPRNISTALMRAWGHRADTVVIDEPFYAFYLHATKLDHPLAAEIIAHGATDWRKVVARLTTGDADGNAIVYQKQMTHHLLPEVGREWLDLVTNCFLIRDPAEVIVSYAKKNGDPTLDDLGFVQQAEIFAQVRARGGDGQPPPVIDAADVLRDPERTLRLLCSALGVTFDRAMLAWPPGLRATDGIWARHWYGEVASSTSFASARTETPCVPGHLREIHERCRECYEQLFQFRLR